MESVLEGIAIGVSSGVILGLFFWLMRGLVSARNEKRAQIKHLASVVAGFRESIYSAGDLDVRLGDAEKHVPRDAVRKTRYDDMQHEVEQVLQGRASRLSFDEIRAVRLAFYTDHFPGVVLNDAGYESVFRALESVEWLGLSPKGA